MTNQQIITVDDISSENAAAIYVQGGLAQFVELARAEVSSEVPDLSTRKGRERIASLAAKVSKSKVAVEKPGRDYLKRLKEMPKVVETELREFVTAMDALRDETRRPLTEWEQAEQERVQHHEERIDWLRNRDDLLAELDAEQISARIAEVEAVALGDQWEEFEAEAARVKDAMLTKLRTALIVRERYDLEQAELARLRQEQVEREQREREERIAREAAERAQREAEHRAQVEREESIRREQQAQAAAERRELELKLQAEQAERERMAAQQRADQAERDAAARAEAAAQAERQRQADEQARIQREAAAREADKKHKASINRTAMEAFIAGGLSEECARQAVTLIAKRSIPNVQISY
ncbi:hypothetical protein [Pseudomonas oryzihabitans]|uniref:hypothetical protein n=1 Tax=Pseudomonas oryzihabitans TaxID=47885 RepID=UPI0028955D63|nr:hypothetical protein [Pseudomonas oryzihabitans]MDT3718474.1 hypothetical protein [Pseudomonas oryzihabitans]